MLPNVPSSTSIVALTLSRLQEEVVDDWEEKDGNRVTSECGPVTGGLSNGDASEDSSTPESSIVDVEEGEVGDNRSGV